MEYGVIKGVEKELSRLIQGTLSMKFESYAESMKLLDGVFELGCNAFDTAHAYNKGETEIVLGKWMTQRHNREKIFIIDKGIDYSQENVKLVPKDITANLLESLERLQSDYIDLYFLHRDDPHVNVEPLIDILNEHKKQAVFMHLESLTGALQESLKQIIMLKKMHWRALWPQVHSSAWQFSMKTHIRAHIV